MKANKSIRKCDDAVSPVIGVILMVAITVILAAVIGAFVFGMGPPKPAPQASLRASEFNVLTSGFTIEHQGGDEISAYGNTTKMLVNGVEVTATVPADYFYGTTGIPAGTIGDKLTVGEQISFTGVIPALTNGAKIVLIDVGSQKPIAQFTVRT